MKTIVDRLEKREQSSALVEPLESESSSSGPTFCFPRLPISTASDRARGGKAACSSYPLRWAEGSVGQRSPPGEPLDGLRWSVTRRPLYTQPDDSDCYDIEISVEGGTCDDVYQTYMANGG